MRVRKRPRGSPQCLIQLITQSQLWPTNNFQSGLLFLQFITWEITLSLSLNISYYIYLKITTSIVYFYLSTAWISTSNGVVWWMISMHTLYFNERLDSQNVKNLNWQKSSGYTIVFVTEDLKIPNKNAPYNILYQLIGLQHL